MIRKFFVYLLAKPNNTGFVSSFLAVLTLCAALFIQPDNLQAAVCGESSTISVEMQHTVGLKEDGTVVATGLNNYGQLNVAGWNGIKAISAGAYHTVGLKEDGTVVAIGDNSYGQLNVAGWNGIKAVSTGWYHTVGLKEDGTVVAIGDNSYGQLNVAGWNGIKAVSTGWYNTVGLKEDGTVVAVGYNFYGQLNVSGWTGIKAVAAGAYHTVGLKEDGTVMYAGAYGPSALSNWTGITAVAAGGAYIVGLKEDGTVVAVGSIRTRGGAVPLNVSGWTGITAVSVGIWGAVGLKEDGTAVASGLPWWGALNVSDWTNIKQPGCLNNPPVASAGPDQVVECAGPSGSSITLDASASSDPDVAPLTYAWTWAGGSAEGATPAVSLPLGTTLVTLTVSDGTATATDTVNITVQDKTPPITTATGGSDNWYNANVISAFSATDSCSGVKEIHYTVNGTETVVLGDSASLTLTTDGIYNIAYYSIDNAGNAESPNSMTVKIDKTPPVLNLSTNPNILWPPNHKMVDVLIGGNATDATSGIASVAFSVTDEYGTIQPSISNFNSTIQLEAWREGTDKDGRHYTITVVAADAAGNKITTSTTVLVPHDQRQER